MFRACLKLTLWATKLVFFVLTKIIFSAIAMAASLNLTLPGGCPLKRFSSSTNEIRHFYLQKRKLKQGLLRKAFKVISFIIFSIKPMTLKFVYYSDFKGTGCRFNQISIDSPISRSTSSLPASLNAFFTTSWSILIHGKVSKCTT